MTIQANLYIKKFTQEASGEWGRNSESGRTDWKYIIIKKGVDLDGRKVFRYKMAIDYKDAIDYANPAYLFNCWDYVTSYKFFREKYPWVMGFLKKYKVINTDEYYLEKPRD